jgi:hypothetical protein
LDNFPDITSMMGGSPSPEPPVPSFLPPIGEQWEPFPYPVRKEPTKAQVEHAKAEIPKMMKRSAEYMETKRGLIELCWDLYFNLRRLNQWYPYQDHKNLTKYQEAILGIKSTIAKAAGAKQPKWRSDFTIACSPFVDSYVESFVQSVFSQDEYFQVKPGPRNSTGSVEDPQFPTSRKIQTKLLQTSNDMLLRAAVDSSMRDAAVTGTLAAKMPWYEETQLQLGINGMGMPEFKEQVIRHGTDLKSLDLSRFLPDPDATTHDCQQWRFVGDRTEVDWEILSKRFQTASRPGPYNVGRKEFNDKWRDSGDSTTQRYSGRFIRDDEDKDTATKFGKGRLQVWEFHGKVHFPGDDLPTECVSTFISDLNSDDPAGGVMVRLQLQPALTVGLRPYCVYHFIRQNGPLGVGIIEQNLDVIWMLSQAQNLFIDACRLMAIPLIKARKDALFTRSTDKDNVGNMLFPGKILEFDSDPNEVSPMWLQADLSSVLQLIQFLEGQLEQRTAISASTRGVQDSRKTATEFAGLIQQSLRPINAKLALFKESVLDVYAKVAVCNLQTYVFEDQQIFVQGVDGVPRPTTLTVEELQTGEYVVSSVLDLPDQTKISKAQTILQVIPVLMQIQLPLLQYENKRIKFSGLIEALLRNLEITEMANVLETVDEMTKQQLLMAMMPPMPGQQNQAPPADQEGQPPGPMVPGTEGGPTGSEPNDLETLLQQIQFAAQNSGPVPVGQQQAAA